MPKKAAEIFENASDSENEIAAAEKDILDNKYDYLMNLINLKFSVGMLTKQDIIETNKYLIMEQ